MKKSLVLIAMVVVFTRAFASDIDPAEIRRKSLSLLEEHKNNVDHWGNLKDSQIEALSENERRLLFFSTVQEKARENCPSVHVSWLPAIALAQQKAMEFWYLNDLETSGMLSQIKEILAEEKEFYVTAQKKLAETNATVRQIELKGAPNANTVMSSSSGGLAKILRDHRAAQVDAHVSRQRIMCFADLETAICDQLSHKYSTVTQVCSQDSVIRDDIFN